MNMVVLPRCDTSVACRSARFVQRVKRVAISQRHRRTALGKNTNAVDDLHRDDIFGLPPQQAMIIVKDFRIGMSYSTINVFRSLLRFETYLDKLEKRSIAASRRDETISSQGIAYDPARHSLCMSVNACWWSVEEMWKSCQLEMASSGEKSFGNASTSKCVFTV